MKDDDDLDFYYEEEYALELLEADLQNDIKWYEELAQQQEEDKE